jgi:hypothetical protein
MNIRLNSQSSQHYLKSLRQVKDFTFNPQPVGETSTHKTPRESLREKHEIDNDRYLKGVIFLTDSGNKISGLFADLDITPISISNLFQAASKKLSDEEPFELYTNATCIEFHQLLVKLLDGFQDTVTKLSGQSKKGPQTFDKTAFQQNLIKGRVYGYALFKMARSRAFRMHMENIEHLLSDYMPDTEASAPVPEGEQESEDEDDELETIRVGSLSKSYGAWLRLMVVHFDAIEILVNFVNGDVGKSYDSISIKFLVPPTTSRKVLPWSELFTDPSIFPTSDLLNPDSTTKSNAEIKQFLEIAIRKAKFASEAHIQAKIAQTSWNTNRPNQTREALKILKDITSSSPIPLKNDILDNVIKWVKLQKNKNNPLARQTANINEEEKKLKQDIDDEIIYICDTYREPPAIDKFYLAFDMEESFSGTLHCEAYLASLLDNFIRHFVIDSNYVDMQALQEMKVDPLIFWPSDSHYVYIGFWSSNWSVETLLPSLFQFPPPYIK